MSTNSESHTDRPKKGSVASRIASLQMKNLSHGTSNRNTHPSIPSPTSSFTARRSTATDSRLNPPADNNMDSIRRHTTGELGSSTQPSKKSFNSKSIAERIAAMKNSSTQNEKAFQAQNVIGGGDGGSKDGGRKVAKLAHNLKGLNVQAIFSGKNGPLPLKKNAVRETTTASFHSSIKGSEEETSNDEPCMDLHHVSRATIGRGKRRGRTFISAQGLKLSSEVCFSI